METELSKEAIVTDVEKHDDPRWAVCFRCAGYGTLVTQDDSSTAGMRVDQCPACQGVGYVLLPPKEKP